MFSANIMVEKFIKGGVKAAILSGIALLTAHKVDTTGIDVETTTVVTAVAAALIGGGFEAARNWLKIKFGVKWL